MSVYGNGAGKLALGEALSNRRAVRRLVESLGSKFSTGLGINIARDDEKEVFRWFLSSILYGARITERIVTNTFQKFSEKQILTPDKILQTGWDGLVQALDAGGYVRYDFKTATKLLDIMKTLTEKYHGSLTNLHNAASDPRDLERRLKELGKGIGDVTANIFLRELRGVWKKACPLPGDLALEAAENLRLVRLRRRDEVGRGQALKDLEKIWKESSVKGKTFVHFEAALVRVGKDFCRKKKCKVCIAQSYCRKRKG